MKAKLHKMLINAKARLIATSTVDEAVQVPSPPLKLNGSDTSDPACSEDQSREIEETMDEIGSSLNDPLTDGQAFDMLNDGEPEDGEQPMVQELTEDDGGIEENSTKELLNDDLPIPNSPTSGN